MAKRMALVPESWLRNLGTSVPDAPHKRTMPVLTTVHEEPEFADFAEILPKRLQARARMLLHYIKGHITVNESQRVVYSDGEVGSHIIDLLRYFTSPFVKQRPVDAPKFNNVLRQAEVPNSAVAMPTWRRL